MSKELQELQEKIDKLDTYVKNKVGFLEGKINEIEQKMEALDGHIRQVITHIHPLSMESASLIELMIEKKIIDVKDLEKTIIKNNEDWVSKMNEKTNTSKVVTP